MDCKEKGAERVEMEVAWLGRMVLGRRENKNENFDEKQNGKEGGILIRGELKEEEESK